MVVSKLLWQIEVEKVILHPIAMPLVTPFETSFGRQELRAAILVEVQTTSGTTGWREVVADWYPGYSYETVYTAMHILNDFLIPRLLKHPVIFSNSKWDWLTGVRGHPMAKHGLISAILTAAAEELDVPLAFLLHQMSNLPQE